MVMILMYLVCLSLLLYSVFVDLLTEPWYWFFLFFIISIHVVAVIVVCAAVTVYGVYKGTVGFISEAWQDFTVDIEPGGRT